MDASVPAPTAPPPPPLRARPYDPTTDHSPPAIESKIQTEFVDVYLLAPEEDRAIELKDFTIMKPKNNKMHRLVRYFPRCEISYTAAPPPEEKLVTSPHGTTTVVTATTHRHNGGFSNPSRNAEVFRLKRKLLSYYMAQSSGDAASGSGDPDAMGGGLRSYKRSSPPSSVSSGSYAAAPPPLPKYIPVPVGDEDSVALTSERTPTMSLKARVQYIDSLWPSIAPVDDDDDIMDYYGLEITIISDEERAKELAAATGTAGSSASSSTSGNSDLNASPAKTPAAASTSSSVASPEKPPSSGAASTATSPQKSEDGGDESPEMTVETRASALQRIKDAEVVKVNPVASKQDDWVQCDKCQKWRRLPNHVNVSELPATWYCKMNRWDKRFNKCSAPEEKIVVLMKESDLLEYRERKFALDFLQRIKRMEKALLQYKYTDARDDDGARKFVQCVECLKKRPLLGGMDPAKIAQPFVCWMNWDELRASCSAPQGALPSRDLDVPTTVAPGDDMSDKSGAVKKSSGKSAVGKSTSGGGDASGKHEPAASSGAAAKKPAKSSTTATANGTTVNSSSNSNAKRKSGAQPSATATDKASSSNNSASINAKKPKRR